MNSSLIRRGPGLTALLVGFVAAAVTMAQAQNKAPVARFSGTVANVSGAGDTLRIDVLRWATDTESAQLSAAMAKDEKELVSLLEKTTTFGYVWTSESAGYSLRHAYRTVMPDGTERMVFITDRRLGAWNPQLFQPTGTAPLPDHMFTLIELRMNKKGEGDAKSSISTKIAVDAQSKLIALDNYATAPTLLKGVKRTQ